MNIINCPGNLSWCQICLDCGSMQKNFDEIQHKQYCEGIRKEQQWRKRKTLRGLEFSGTYL